MQRWECTSLFPSMSADFWAGYVSGAIGIAIGNPLDLIKVRLQARNSIDAIPHSVAAEFNTPSSLVRGQPHM